MSKIVRAEVVLRCVRAVGWIAIIVSGSGGPLLSQGPVQLNPTGNQTIQQPSGTSLTISGSGVLQVPFLGVGDGSLSMANGNLALSAGSSASIVFDAASNADRTGSSVITLLTDGQGPGYFSIQDTAFSTTILCGTTDNDFVGVGGENCNPFDILDVSNRETFGNGYMHWFQNGAAYNQWNAGISNPSPGTLSFDGTTNADGLGSINVANITMPQGVSGATSGSHITFSDGSNQSTAWNGTTFGGDYAESVDVDGPREEYRVGDLISIDPGRPGRFIKAVHPYSQLVAGVYSTNPGLTGRRTTFTRSDRQAEVPMAMMGIAPLNVNAENGPIKPGDLLVSSSEAGFAMKGTDATRLTGAVIGKALDTCEANSCKIEALITLQ